MKSRNYSESEKFAAVERFLVGGESVATIAADTGISRSTLYAWIKSAQIEPGMLEFTRKNFRMLEAKVKRLEGIVEILQIANCTANAPLNEKLQALEELHGQYNVYILCDALKVPRGTFYNYIFRNKRDNTWYAKRREELRIRIQQIYDESKQIFGAGKITAVMKEEGYKVSQEMVRELMRDMGLLSIRQDAKKVYAKERRSLKNHLNQQFEVTRPNEVWVSDVTYFLCKDIKFYICAIIDLYARRIVGYRVGKRNSTQLVKSTFKQAYCKRRNKAIHNKQQRSAAKRSILQAHLAGKCMLLLAAERLQRLCGFPVFLVGGVASVFNGIVADLLQRPALGELCRRTAQFKIIEHELLPVVEQTCCSRLTLMLLDEPQFYIGGIIKVARLFRAVLLQFLRILRPLLHGLRCHVRQQLLDHDFKFILLHDDLLVLGFVRHQPPLRQLLAGFS